MSVQVSQKTLDLVNKYIQLYRTTSWKPDVLRIRKALGWNRTQWQIFVQDYKNVLVWDHIPELETPDASAVTPQDMVVSAAPVPPIDARGISAAEVAQVAKAAHIKLRSDLRQLGLTSQECDAAMGMQNFGKSRFADAMHMVSSSVFKTAMKLQTIQDILADQMKVCQKQIDGYGPIQSEDRDRWIEEMKGYVKQFALVGKLLNDIQRTWYEGAAELAMVEWRIKHTDDSGPAKIKFKGEGKPGFRATVIESTPEDEQDADQIGDAATAS